MAKDNGGPAFPVSEAVDRFGGMTLRDYFAGQAMTNWRIDDKDVAQLLDGLRPEWKMMAEVAYEFADAMLTERSK